MEPEVLSWLSGIELRSTLRDGSGTERTISSGVRYQVTFTVGTGNIIEGEKGL